MNSELEMKSRFMNRNMLSIRLTDPEYNVNLKPHGKFSSQRSLYLNDANISSSHLGISMNKLVIPLWKNIDWSAFKIAFHLVNIKVPIIMIVIFD